MGTEMRPEEVKELGEWQEHPNKQIEHLHQCESAVSHLVGADPGSWPPGHVTLEKIPGFAEFHPLV